MFATLPQELGSDSAPLRYRCPKALLHGSSPLARQERCSTLEFPTASTSSSPSTAHFPTLPRQKSLPPFEDIFNAAAEQPPPYQAVLPVPNASFYGLAFERRLETTRAGKGSASDPMDVDDSDLRYLRSLRNMSHGDDDEEAMELDTPSPTSIYFDAAPIHSLGSWASWSPPPRESLKLGTRDRTPSSRRKLDSLRTNFINEHIPHLSHSLYHFENRVRTGAPVVEVFYDWYEGLGVDQRVKHMPYFIPERLDMVQVTPKPATKVETVKAPIVQRKPASFDSPAVTSISEEQPLPSSEIEVDAQAQGRGRSPSPPPAFNAPHEPCDWDEFERMVRWARVLPKRKASRDMRKEAAVRAWTEAVEDMGLSQWYVFIHLTSKGTFSN